MATIRVIGAAYGSKEAGADVTGIVQERLNAGNDDVIVNNDNFGDPHPGDVARAVWHRFRHYC